jgi:hypothetical protein
MRSFKIGLKTTNRYINEEEEYYAMGLAEASIWI